MRAQTAHGGAIIQVSSGFSAVNDVAVDSKGNVFAPLRGANQVKEIVAVNGAVSLSSSVVNVGSGFNGPLGAAVDPSGNVFVADSFNGAVKEIMAVNGMVSASSTVVTVGSGFSEPTGVALDRNGNLFVADLAQNAVKEIVAVGGVVSASSTVITVGSGFVNPASVAVDTSGNVFVTDANNVVTEIVAVDGVVSSSSTVMTVGSGFGTPSGLAVDGSGNVFVADFGTGKVQEIVAVNGVVSSTSTVVTIGSGFSKPSGLALDSSGNIFVGDFGDNTVREIVAGAQKFPTTAVGSTSAPLTIYFTFDSAGTLAATPYVALTQGAQNLDFKAAASQPANACVTGHSYNAGDICAVNVTFTPTRPYQRIGAVQLMGSAGTPIATFNLKGTGTGPQALFPGNSVVSTVGSGFSQPNGVAVDGSGNVFVADFDVNAVKEIVAVNGVVSSSSTVNIIGSGFSNPLGVAVDGSGNVFVADQGNGAVKEIVAVNGVVSSSSTVLSVGSDFYAPYGVAVDGSGNVFVADPGNSAVKEIVAVNGVVSSSSTVNIIGSGFYAPTAVAVDASGNVFVADYGHHAVEEIVAVNGVVSSSSTVLSVGSGFSVPEGVAVDGSGNVFVADTSNSAVKEIVAVNGVVSSSSTVLSVGSGLSFPYGVAVDGGGNVFVADNGHNAVKEINRADPPSLTFAPTAVNSTSSDSPQSVVFQNSGNATLTISNLVIGSNFAQVAGSGTPADCTSSTALNADASCNLSLSFTPTVVGPLSASATITDNALNVTGATQAIQLTGTGTQASQIITFGTPSNQNVGAQFNLVASSTSNLTVTFSTSSAATICTLNGTQVTTNGPGTCTITASQNGNADYAAATPVQRSFMVSQLSQIITFNAIASQPLGGTLALSASASSNLPVSFSSSTTLSVCTITNNSTANFISTGTCSITASQAGNGTYAAATSVTQSFSVVGGTPFITTETPGPLRNNYTGFVGLELTVGATPVTVYSLGRFVIAGNTQTHTLKLVQANGTDVVNASVSLATAGATAGKFAYAPLQNAVTLLANTSYYLVSQETAGGDRWYDYGSITTSGVASVVGPVYVNQMNNYVPVTVLTGNSYVPVSFLYAPPTTSLSVSITSPAANGTISGSASITVSTTGPVTSLQVQVDGSNQGSAVPVSVNQGPSYTLSLDTTVLMNGSHSLTVVASDATSDIVTSPAVSVTITNSPGGSTPFVIGQTPGALRNNYSGFVGLALNVGSTPVVVTSLGRFVAPNNSGTHLMKLVSSHGTDVPGGSVSISLSGATAGTYRYATLPAGPLTLQTGTTYYLVSQETAGGDQWYDYGAVSTTSVATVLGPVYTNGGGAYTTVGGLGGDSYVPVSFLYGPTANTISATITSPQNGALLSGNNIPVTVTTTGSVTSLQLQVDGVNQGAAVGAGPLTLNTTGLSNGQHALTVMIAEGNSATALSPGIIVTVNNGGGVTTSFVSSETPSSLRNNYSGFVGFAINVGTTPISVVSLGRFVVSGNTGTHTVELVQANGTPVAGGSVSIVTAGATAGQFAYAALAAPVALLANTTYYLVSQETAGGDSWYNLEPVATTAAGQISGPAYSDANGNFVIVSGFPGYSYVPVSFKYQ